MAFRHAETSASLKTSLTMQHISLMPEFGLKTNVRYETARVFRKHPAAGFSAARGFKKNSAFIGFSGKAGSGKLLAFFRK